MIPNNDGGLQNITFYSIEKVTYKLNIHIEEDCPIEVEGVHLVP